MPFAPGGSDDLAGRAFAKYAASQLGQPVNVTNVEGASGITGTEQAMSATADGYTLMVDAGATSSSQAAYNPQVPYNFRNRTYIGQFATSQYFFIVNAQSKYTTLKSLMAFAKANPTQFSWAAGGAGSDLMFCGVALLQAAGVPVHSTRMVTFAGGQAPSVQAVASGEVLFGIASLSNAKALSAAGKVRVLAVAGTEKSSSFPNVPATASLGYTESANADDNGWVGLSGPPGMSKALVQKWDALLKSADASASFQSDVGKLGLSPAYLPGSQFQSFVFGQYNLLKSETKIIPAA